MITDTPCANTTVATLSGAPAMTTSSSSSSNSSNSSSSSTSSSSSSTASSLVTTPAISVNSGLLGVVGGGITVQSGGGGGNSNITGTGGISSSTVTAVATGISAGSTSITNQANSNLLVGSITTGGNLVGQGGANINSVVGVPQQSGPSQQQQQQQLSPTQQQTLSSQPLNTNVTPNTCPNNTTSNSNSITSSSSGNNASVTTTSIALASGSNSISTNSTVSSLMHIKEEPNLLETSKEDDTSSTTPPNMSGINIKKEPMHRMNLNGSTNSSNIIGSTNTGSLHHSDKNTSDSDDRKSGVRDGNDLGSDFETNFNIGVLGGKDDMLSETTVGIGGLGTLSNVKKEEPGPDLTSDGFGSLGSGLSSGSGNASGNVSMPPSSGSCSGAAGGGRIPTGASSSEGIQPLSSNILGSTKQGGIGGGGGLDYMQQQNHIFVFSTSLANKGAESVMSGQYPTIIAYHCAQPTTKKFLEDFFLKNPLKLSKMNRQNPVQWMSNSIPMIGKTNKTSNNSSGNNSSNNNNSNANRMGPTSKPPTSNNSGFTNDDLSATDAELLPWEQSGNHMSLDAMANGAGNTVNAPPTSDSSGLEGDNLVPGSPSISGSRSCSNHMPNSTASSGASVQQSSTTMSTSALGPTSPSLSGLQPSLQGVKVPDENLTPQQRQHREEQLAKLKKMNQFLFPEQGGMCPDFVGSNVTPEADSASGVPAGTKMMGPVGPPGQGPVNMIPGMPGSGQMSIGGNIGGVPSSLRGSGMLGMGPRPGMCRPMGGPMGPSSMPDGIMGSSNINDMTGIPCGVMMGNQQGPGGQSLMGNANTGPSMGGIMPGVPMGQQSMVQGGPMGLGGPMNPCAVGNPMGPGIMGQNKHMMGGPGMAQMEWTKLQHQFYEERKGKGLEGLCPSGAANMCGGRQIPPVMRANSQGGSRSQGPPPPYHQTQRSASVPIATQSPNPGSPNNPTSNLSLPSPRTGSTLNSPAGDHVVAVSSGNQQQQCGGSTGRQQQQSSQQLPYKQDSPVTNSGCSGSAGGTGPANMGGTNGPRGSHNHNSNPGTPISSHLSPNASLKDLELGTTNSSSGGQGKEPNLMPVPSPQQIQYLNTFEGQELTIQKQPNTTLKDGSIISSSGSNGPSGGGNGGGSNSVVGNAANDSRISGTSTPLTPSSIEPRFPTTPGTGGQVSVTGGGGASAGSTFPIPSSPQTPNAGNAAVQGASEKCQRLNTSGPSPQGSRTPSMSGDPVQGNAPNLSQSSVDSVRYSSTSPGMNFSPVTGSNQGGGTSNQQVNAMKLGGFMDVSPNGKCTTSTNDTTPTSNFCVRADNLPLNPNSSCPPPAKTSHFDPISSLAQMSQQLTSSVSNSLNGQPGGGGPGPGGGGGGNPSGGIMGNFQNHGGMGMAADMSMAGHHVEGLMSGLDPCSMGVMPGIAQYGLHGSGNAGIPLGMMGGPGPRSLSPKLGSAMVGFPGGPVGMPHRMIGRPPMGGNPYNGANIQVKASTPNTIQYLPARPQVGNTNPRAPPSLEFLQRFANPMSAMEGPPNKIPSGQGMPFYPNCNQMGQPGPGGLSMNAHLDAASSLGSTDGSGMLGMGGMGPAGPMMGQNLMMRGLRPPGQGGMVRMSGPPHIGGSSGGHHHHPFNNGPPNLPNDPSMFPGSQMFSAGSKVSPMSAGGPNGPGNPNHPNQMPGGPPDASQPLPPTMGGGQAPGGGAFKSSQFVGPSTADPNYAQQYHNFQQQLYATSTRSQINNQAGGGMGGGPTNQSFFVPK